MREEQFRQIESYMRSCLRDSAHDREHIYRVLYTALAIAQDETTADGDVLITSCLLHDIGRPEQFADPALCHAVVGAKKAYDFLIGSGYPPAFAGRVSDCIRTHRFRSSDPPASIEAKILFDADKIDATGALGIARTLLYKGLVGEPLYSVSGTGAVLDGSGAEGPSFFQEYKFKLEGLYSRFYTRRGREIALSHRQAAVNFYQSMLAETVPLYQSGLSSLSDKLK